VKADVGAKVDDMIPGAGEGEDAVHLVPREFAIDPQRAADDSVAAKREHRTEAGFGPGEDRHGDGQGRAP
jgi:hypothetical protein